VNVTWWVCGGKCRSVRKEHACRAHAQVHHAVPSTSRQELKRSRAPVVQETVVDEPMYRGVALPVTLPSFRVAPRCIRVPSRPEYECDVPPSRPVKRAFSEPAPVATDDTLDLLDIVYDLSPLMCAMPSPATPSSSDVESEISACCLDDFDLDDLCGDAIFGDITPLPSASFVSAPASNLFPSHSVLRVPDCASIAKHDAAESVLPQSMPNCVVTVRKCTCGCWGRVHASTLLSTFLQDAQAADCPLVSSRHHGAPFGVVVLPTVCTADYAADAVVRASFADMPVEYSLRLSTTHSLPHSFPAPSALFVHVPW
jgi:hypothetical protein